MPTADRPTDGIGSGESGRESVCVCVCVCGVCVCVCKRLYVGVSWKRVCMHVFGLDWLCIVYVCMSVCGGSKCMYVCISFGGREAGCVEGLENVCVCVCVLAEGR